MDEDESLTRITITQLRPEVLEQLKSKQCRDHWTSQVGVVNGWL